MTRFSGITDRFMMEQGNRDVAPEIEAFLRENQAEQLFGFKRGFGKGDNSFFCQNIYLSYFFKCILINRTKNSAK